MIEYIDLKIDFAKRNDRLSGITLDRVTTRSYDTAIKFRIEIADHVLDDTYDVKILSKYSYNQSQILYKVGDNLEFLDGKLIYTPKVDLITEADYVRNYLYLSKDGLGLDMAQFNYEVDLSEIDKTALKVKSVYDQSYETLLAEFEQALEDYKLTLPQADSVRADIDEILNQFSEDSQAKLNQYDDDAQQAIADWRSENSNELSSLQTEVEKKANRKQEDWITPTLLNGWTDFGGVYESVGYMKDEFGFVHIRGMIKGGTVGQIAFMLPEGYKPLKSQYHTCISADVVRILNVQRNGTVLTSPLASNAWITLNGISFKAEA